MTKGEKSDSLTIFHLIRFENEYFLELRKRAHNPRIVSSGLNEGAALLGLILRPALHYIWEKVFLNVYAGHQPADSTYQLPF